MKDTPKAEQTIFPSPGASPTKRAQLRLLAAILQEPEEILLAQLLARKQLQPEVGQLTTLSS